jgi:hypothetical protein
MEWGVILHGLWRAAVGVAFAENRVHRGTENLCIARANLFFGLGLRVFGKLRKCVPLGLEFRDGGFELRDGGADVG